MDVMSIFSVCFGKGFTNREPCGMCAKHHQQGRSWFQAYNQCKAENSSLVIIRTARKHDCIIKMIEPQGNINTFEYHMYIGFQYTIESMLSKVFLSIK